MEINADNPLYLGAKYQQELIDKVSFLDNQGNQLLQQIEVLKSQITPATPPWLIQYNRILAAGQFAAYLGIPYLFGAEYKNNKAFDCSSLTQALFGFVGISLPRVSKDQATRGTAISGLENARQGDLLFFDYSTTRNGIDHVGIYVGSGKMLHTNDPAKPIRIETLSTYQKSKLVAIRRVL